MKVFCPNCGSPGEGTPGGRLTCRTCTASFEVPPESTGNLAPPTPQPWPGLGSAPIGAPRPDASGPDWVAGQKMPSQPTSASFTPSTSARTNPLAIVSLVLGILCCFPFAVGAIITGVIARNQIASSGGLQKGGELATVGIVLGSISIAINLLMMLTGFIG